MDRIARSRDGLQHTRAGLSDQRLSTPGPNGWSIKDHLAHLAVWEEHLIALLDGRDGLEEMGVETSGGTDAANEQIRARYASGPPAEVRALLASTHARALAAIEALGEDGLERPYSSFRPGTNREDADLPIAEWVLGNTCDHFDEHRAWILTATPEGRPPS